MCSVALDMIKSVQRLKFGVFVSENVTLEEVGNSLGKLVANVLPCGNLVGVST